MAISAYRGATAVSGRIRLLKDLDQPVRGEHVVVVEDVIDTGLTLHNLMTTLRVRDPASVRSARCSTVRTGAWSSSTSRYVGFTAAEPFVVGYGLGHHQRFRHLPDIHLLAR